MPAAAALSARAFGFQLDTPERATAWRARIEHLLLSDPAGGFVAEREGQVIGLAQAMLRERLWCLSLLTVDPAAQSAGAGRALFDAALAYGAGERRAAVIVASNDPRAITLYARAGFAIRPTLAVEGPVASALPPVDPRVRRVGLDALDELAPLSRALRGAAHTEELHFEAGARGARVLALEDRGFVVAGAAHAVWLLAARDEAAAEALLIAALSERPAVPEVAGWITAEQGWATRALVGLGLRLRTWGPLCVSGDIGPLAPYLPSPAFG